MIPERPLDYVPKRKFINHKDAVGVLDATLIMVSKPLDKEENNMYFSGKHKKHGVKLQVLVAPDGLCIHFGGVVPGRRNDFYSYNYSGLSRTMEHSTVGMDGIKTTHRPPILADGGYMEIQNTYPEAIIPKRKPLNGHLTREQKEFNRLLSQDRSVVERFFGRMKGYWGILKKPYRGERASLDVLAQICVGLTNLKIKNAPLFLQEAIRDPDYLLEVEEEEEGKKC